MIDFLKLRPTYPNYSAYVTGNANIFKPLDL